MNGKSIGLVAALIVASEKEAKANGLTPRARVVAMAAAGVAPRIMGIGPVPAMRKVLGKSGFQTARSADPQVVHLVLPLA